MFARSFPPLASAESRVLILGSMPGQASLQAGQYYAHPRNAFWSIMGELFDAGPQLDYHERQQCLNDAGVAVWDVLYSCNRPGSLDSAIDSSSLVVNDFVGFLTRHPQITHVFFNGAKAQQCFDRYALKLIRDRELQRERLPSTSPAHAAMSFKQKLQAWQRVKDVLGQSSSVKF